MNRLFENLVPGSIKASMRDAGASSRDLWQVPLQHLKAIPGFNVRVRDAAYEAHIRSLADSMKSEGYRQSHPLSGFVANENGISVIYYYDGHSRLEAVALANSEGAEIDRVPVVISQSGTSILDLTVALVKENNSKPLTAFETSIVCKRLSSYGWELARIAERLSFSIQYVDNLLLLAAAPPQIQEMVQRGEVSAAQAVEIMRSAGSQAVDILKGALETAKAQGKSRVTARHLPGSAFKKVVKKQALTMAETFATLVQDPSFTSLSDELQQKIKTLVDTINAARAEAQPADDATGESAEMTAAGSGTGTQN